MRGGFKISRFSRKDTKRARNDRKIRSQNIRELIRENDKKGLIFQRDAINLIFQHFIIPIAERSGAKFRIIPVCFNLISPLRQSFLDIYYILGHLDHND